MKKSFLISIQLLSILLMTSLAHAAIPDFKSDGGINKSVLSFIALGDWGTGKTAQKNVAKAMGKYCKANDCDFVLTMGDNFYSKGVKSVSDSYWKDRYRDVYGSLKIPFYSMLGNHDMYGNEKAQIQYSKVDPSWIMPAEYYSITKKALNRSPLMEVFVINSGDYKIQEKEKQWLVNKLKASKAPWKILATHVPLISNGKHGDDSADLNKTLIPLICDKVNFVLSGHDHIFSHMKDKVGECPVEQLVVGNGGKTSKAKKDKRALGSGSFPGFGWFQVARNKILFKMIKEDGSVFYETSWKI